MNSENAMKDLADALWAYFAPKVSQLMSSAVRFYRAEVVAAAQNGKITVQRPFDPSTTALPYVQAMSGAKVGDQVTVFVFGSSDSDSNNAVIVNTGTYSL